MNLKSNLKHIDKKNRSRVKQISVTEDTGKITEHYPDNTSSQQRGFTPAGSAELHFVRTRKSQII